MIEPPGVDTTSDLWGVIDNPIRSYIGHHSVALMWALASIFALRGLSLHPVINSPEPATPQVNIYPAIHIPPQPTPVHDGLDDVHPLQR
ncbi:hypothetical protein ACFY4K_34695 [Streptomyces leeuwenhoekii]|uniref:hypothetical protein n=1 Tax=Streptomyces leeuwenhoekii TaxID=1437453 RepID=UPI0036901997